MVMLLMYGKLYIFEAEKSSLGDARFAPLAQHLFWRSPADQLIGPLEPSGDGIVRRARRLQAETRGKPGELPAAAQRQRLRLAMRQQEETGRIAVRAVGQSSEHRLSERHHHPD